MTPAIVIDDLEPTTGDGMHVVRVVLACGWTEETPSFSTLVIVTAEAFAAGAHVAEAEHRARLLGYAGPFHLERCVVVAASAAGPRTAHAARASRGRRPGAGA